jgi:hypothetical protein
VSQFFRKREIIVVKIYWAFFLGEHRTGIYFFVENKNTGAGFVFAFQKSSLNRGGAAVFGQKGKVHVDSFEGRQIDDVKWKDFSISHYNENICTQAGQFLFKSLVIFDSARFKYFDF